MLLTNETRHKTMDQFLNSHKKINKSWLIQFNKSQIKIFRSKRNKDKTPNNCEANNKDQVNKELKRNTTKKVNTREKENIN